MAVWTPPLALKGEDTMGFTRCSQCGKNFSDRMQLCPFCKFPLHRNVSEFDEDAIFAEALSELKSGTARPGLWAKAFAESEGDENKSQALYIKLRVQQERENRQQEQKAASALRQSSHSSQPISVSHQNAATSEVSKPKKGPSGVGGWLFLLVAGLLVLGPLFGAGGINADMKTLEDQYPALKSLPRWANFKAVTWWTFFAAAALSIWGGWGLARGKDWSVVKRAKFVLWLTGPVGVLVMGVIVPMATLGKSSAAAPQFLGHLIGSMIAAGIWTAYLSKSNRVRNTYGSAN
jgi:hypothetical protein